MSPALRAFCRACRRRPAFCLSSFLSFRRLSWSFFSAAAAGFFFWASAEAAAGFFFLASGAGVSSAVPEPPFILSSMHLSTRSARLSSDMLAAPFSVAIQHCSAARVCVIGGSGALAASGLTPAPVPVVSQAASASGGKDEREADGGKRGRTASWHRFQKLVQPPPAGTNLGMLYIGTFPASATVFVRPRASSPACAGPADRVPLPRKRGGSLRPYTATGGDHAFFCLRRRHPGRRRVARLGASAIARRAQGSGADRQAARRRSISAIRCWRRRARTASRKIDTTAFARFASYGAFEVRRSAEREGGKRGPRAIDTYN